MSYLVKNFFAGAAPPAAQQGNNNKPQSDVDAMGNPYNIGSPTQTRPTTTTGHVATTLTNAFTSKSQRKAQAETRLSQEICKKLLRVQTSSVPRDRREALGELCEIGAGTVARCVAQEDIAMLVSTARLNSRDLSLLVKVLEVLCHVTADFDPTMGVAASTNNYEDFSMGDAEVDIDNRDRILADLLHNHVDLFTDIITGDVSEDLRQADGVQDGASLSTAAFWARYNAVKLLQRLQDHDGLSLPKILVDGHSLHSLIALLNDTSNDGMLRNEGMLLLNSLTMSDKELQKILAFSDCFETLFAVIQEEGGVDGGIIVIDALSIIRNILRSNDPTQKYFKEMGFAERLIPLMVDCSSSAGAEGLPLTERGRDVVMFAVDVISCLLVHSGSSKQQNASDDFARTQDKLVKSGVVPSLARVGLSQSLDEKTSIAGLRVLMELVKGSKSGCEALLLTETKVMEAKKVPALWTLLYTTLYHRSTARQGASLRIIEAVLTTPSVAARAASVLVKGLAPTQNPGQGSGLSCGYLLGTCLMSQQQSSQSTTANGGGAAAHGGFFTNPAPNAMHHSALILNLLLQVPLITTQLIHIPWSNNVTFFVAFVSHLIRVMKQREADLGTTTRLFMPLFSWLEHCGASTSMLLSDPAHFAAFEKWAANKKAPVSIRLLCTLVCLRVCLAAQTQELPPTVRVTKDELAMAFSHGQQSVNNLMFSVTADQDWKEAPSSSTAESSSHDGIVTWDGTMKEMVTRLLQEIEDNKGHIGDKANVSLDGGSSSAGANQTTGIDSSIPTLEKHDARQLQELLSRPTGDQAALEEFIQRLQGALRDSFSTIHAQQAEHAAVKEQLELVAEDYGKTSQHNEQLQADVDRLKSEADTASVEAAATASSTPPVAIAVTPSTPVGVEESTNNNHGHHGGSAEEDLRSLLEETIIERDELYILVAELDEEFSSLRSTLTASRGAHASEEESLL